MTLTHGTQYSNYMTGLLYGQRGWLDKMNSAFDIAGGPAAGVAYAHMWDTVTVETPTADTFLAQGMANTATALTLTHSFATQLFTVSTSGSLETTDNAMRTWAQSAANTLYATLQNVVVAALKAGTITTNTADLSTTFIDFAVPASTTTTAAMVLEYMQPLNKCVATMLASKADDPNLNNYWIAMPPAAWGNLQGLASYDVGVTAGVTQDGIFGLKFKGIPVYVINGATNFGGASYEVVFGGHRNMFACKHSDVRPWRGGQLVQDPDGQIRRSFYIAYATGLVKEALGFEINNPKS